MIKKLTKIGNSVGLVIDQTLLELYHFDENAEIIPQEGGFLIKPAKPDAKPDRRRRFRRALNEFTDQYAETLKKLS